MFQKVVLSIVLFFAFSIVAFFLLIKVIDFNEYKPRLQKMIKDATGYELIIKGDITLSLSPVGISVLDIEVFNPHEKEKGAFATLKSFDVALEVAPLLTKEIKIHYLSLDSLALTLEKNEQEQFNFELPTVSKKEEAKPSTEQNTTLEKAPLLPLVNVKEIKFSNAHVSYHDVRQKETLQIKGINFDIDNIHYDPSKHKFQGLSFIADASIGSLNYGEYGIKEIYMPLEMKESVLSSENVQFTLFETPSQGTLKIDLSGKQPKLSLKSKLEQLKLAQVSKEILKKEILEGKANADLKLSFFLNDTLTFKNTVNGFIHVSGENVTFKGYDIDKIVTSVDASKGLSMMLLNVIKSTQEAKTLLKEVNAKVDIGYSEVHLSDVAASTAKNRLAIKGSVNIVEEKFQEMKVALLNAKGCATLTQTIEGTFQKPVFNVNETVLNTLSQVAFSLLNKSKSSNKTVDSPQVETDENCTVFYEGVVKHPSL
ncbi:AsmA family protein [Sulfurospirillum deleyianum]|uniref:Uncharacterized protein involved in outer membrane biogenesis n=1 Tax=Sulfurospirillum deleyianum (strain ATCC 51133 / DSM 6946 / 5175) TaxID=525898 RepID=D1B3U0_SULD5|nr:AsmA family protein [Sulfurospirillum deleyianum]ACZ12760.1 Uncharacterized protein involved in outer membrane biogenesis [Sulfurospirillum deleyianum DSM 6946]